jgi:uncharacterized protein (TIGR02611 family)
MHKLTHHLKRTLIAIAGTIVILVGIVLIPYPGPGWLVVFAGLAILATEFAFAERLLARGRRYFSVWEQWVKRQGWPIQILILGFTGIVIVVTIWLVNGFGILNALFNLHQNWLISPLFR